MAKKAYVGINGISKNVEHIYVGVNGVARKVIKGYVGDENGIAQQFWGDEKPDNQLDVKIITSMHDAMSNPLQIEIETSIDDAMTNPLGVTITTRIIG